jgi:hypothetical protein
MNTMEYFTSGVCGFGLAILLLIVTGATPKATQEKFEKQAFTRGYMEKIINDKDEVIYRWKEKQ